MDPTPLEEDLRKLRAAGLDPSFLDRLDASIDGSWTKPGPMELQQERALAAFAPVKLSPDLAASLEATLAGVAFPGSGTIVRFPLEKQAAGGRRRGWYGAAAAVALCGALTALWVPANHGGGTVAANPNGNHTTPPAQHRSELVPAGFNRGLSEASDEGVIWKSSDQPHRVLKVVYKDQVTLKDANGHTYQVEQPRVEYILVPAKNH